MRRGDERRKKRKEEARTEPEQNKQNKTNRLSLASSYASADPHHRCCFADKLKPLVT
jgi:hypothetical protein